MEEDAKTTDTLLDDAIKDAFADLDRDSSEDNVKKVETLVKLQTEREKNQQDYYVKATEIDNETQRIDIQERKDRDDSKIPNILKKYIPEFIKTGISSTTLLGAIILIRRYEEKGYLIKFGELGKFFRI